MIRFAVFAAALLATPALAQTAAQDGAKLFVQRCKACHAMAPTPIGPGMAGVYGAKIASRPGFKYSPGLTAKSAGTWNDANLEAFLAGPTKFAPGSRMMIVSPTPAERAAIIAHLKTLK